MSSDPFDDAMRFAWRPENDGQGFHPRDVGGATTWGATFATWSAWQRLYGATPSMAAFRVLGPDELRPLYRALFWNACGCGSLPIGVGPITLTMARNTPPARLIDALCIQRETFYARLPRFRIYGAGWDRRAEDCRRLALGLAAPL